jgi:hypothetical protein
MTKPAGESIGRAQLLDFHASMNVPFSRIGVKRHATKSHKACVFGIYARSWLEIGAQLPHRREGWMKMASGLLPTPVATRPLRPQQKTDTINSVARNSVTRSGSNQSHRF